MNKDAEKYYLMNVLDYSFSYLCCLVFLLQNAFIYVSFYVMKNK